VPRLTRIQELPRDRVALELDGQPWRVVPTTAVARAGLCTGQELDRERARAFRRELRRADALDVASRVLARRDAARAELEQRLERRGVAPAARDEALERLTELGAVDDERFARSRAAQLAERGYGDEAIRADLELRGVAAEALAEALAGVAPEVERARPLIAARGVGSKTAAFLGRRGFGEDVLELAAGEAL
jgi:SOS response regulatory protein OraA/RecX